MTESMLAAAVSAARAEAEVGADDGAATRLRIRESLAKRRSKKRLWTLLAAAIGTMFASTAFALQAGWEPPWSSRTEAVAPAAPEPEPAAPNAPRPRVVASSPSTSVRYEAMPPPSPSGVTQVAAEVASPPAPPAPPASSSATRGVAPASASPSPTEARAEQTSSPVVAEPSPSVESAPPPQPPAPDPELAAYRTAHAQHFRGGDPKAALAAWDAQLAQFPSGRLAPEARFNRALVLIKLERWADARAALTAFATAPVGSYRQREASQLLAAIANR